MERWQFISANKTKVQSSNQITMNFKTAKDVDGVTHDLNIS